METGSRPGSILPYRRPEKSSKPSCEEAMLSSSRTSQRTPVSSWREESLAASIADSFGQSRGCMRSRSCCSCGLRSEFKNHNLSALSLKYHYSRLRSTVSLYSDLNLIWIYVSHTENDRHLGSQRQDDYLSQGYLMAATPRGHSSEQPQQDGFSPCHLATFDQKLSLGPCSVLSTGSPWSLMVLARLWTGSDRGTAFTRASVQEQEAPTSQICSHNDLEYFRRCKSVILAIQPLKS